MKKGYIKTYKTYRIIGYWGGYVITNQHGATVTSGKTIKQCEDIINKLVK